MNELESVWVCHECQMVGTAAEAKAHNMVRDHAVAELTHEESARIRALWWEDQAKRVAGYLLAARGRGPFAAAWDKAGSDEGGACDA